MLTLHNVDEKGKLLTLRARRLVYIYLAMSVRRVCHFVPSSTPFSSEAGVSWKLNAPGGICLRLTRLLAHHSMDSLFR